MCGSRLTWIDNFFSSPLTPADRTLGQHVDFLRTEQIFSPDGLRGRVFQKEFRYGESVAKIDPQKHGDFDRCPFWLEEFYTLRHAPQDPRLFCGEE